MAQWRNCVKRGDWVWCIELVRWVKLSVHKRGQCPACKRRVFLFNEEDVDVRA